MTPFCWMMSRPTWKGERFTTVFPAASRRDWMITFTVSIGWITAEATLPDSDPTRNGFAYDQNTPSLIKQMIYLIRKVG